MTKQPEKIPAEATAEHGEVMIDGPDGLALSLTPDAARQTAHSIDAAAREAQDQPTGAMPSDNRRDSDTTGG
ncbi:hypothetical protein AWL63_09615 [Sphingomonas panacis]|uniref:Uncharacterized protein n=1 Tax=Sphingomonas panacis TaxID=1560345 RepID=A0A1B3Z9V1_9SPHN|nr:hypothetical protein [Sphingomonas panacis]AOH84187.1 hypothetical protein AWL63_09615 [Sphingomonas panacis]